MEAVYVLDIRRFLFERLSDERMYSVYDLFVLLAELMNESIEDTDFYGFNIEEIEKIVAEDYEEHKCFERRRDGAMLESSEDTYLMNKIFVFDLLDEVQSRIKLKKDVFYSVKDVLKRLEYPAHLDKYYFDKPWSDFDKTYIQRIIKEDYEGVSEFYKQYDGWTIYGSDENYKDDIGKHDLSSRISPRPKGYEKRNAGVPEYLMNWEYVKNLAYELERRKFASKHKISLKEIELGLSNINRTEIAGFANDFLFENQQYYFQELEKLDVEKSTRTNQYNSMIQRIEDCISYGYFEHFVELDELIERMKALNTMKKFKLSYQIVLKNVVERIDEVFIPDEECRTFVAKSLYNKQNKVEKDFKNYRQSIFVAIGECSKCERKVLVILQEIKQQLSGKQLDIFTMLLKDELEKAEMM